MAVTNEEEKSKQIEVSGEQIVDAVNKIPTIETDIKNNASGISRVYTDMLLNRDLISDLTTRTSDAETAISSMTDAIQKNTADIENRYTKSETDAVITEKVSEIVSGAPEDFNTLKEMSDWLLEHEDSAAAMNTAIQKNTSDIATKLDKTDIVVLTQSEYDSLTEKTAPFYFIKEGETV